jgi:hypothetical protein
MVALAEVSRRTAPGGRLRRSTGALRVWRWQFIWSVHFEHDDGRVECDWVERFGWVEQYWRFQLRRFQRFRQLQWLRLRRLG